MADPVPTVTSGGFALLHDTLTVPPVHIPDGTGGAYKTELVIERTPQRTIKIIWWHADDPRPEPHNHPWDFESEILVGGYSEERWQHDSDGDLCHEWRVYRSDGASPTEEPGRGNLNRVNKNVYHRVYDVIPGTVTRLTCGPAVPGNAWEYLNVDTGERLGSDDPNFLGHLREINPHLRPKVEG